MKKTIFTMECSFELKDNELAINFGIDSNEEAEMALGKENYDKYIQDVVKVLTPVTKEINDLTVKLFENGITRQGKDILKDVLNKILKELEGE